MGVTVAAGPAMAARDQWKESYRIASVQILSIAGSNVGDMAS
jgi:hypothetical protein